nr:MAG: RNA-dependent RNA polymerase [Wenzhou rodent phenuivirus 1]
MDRTRSYSKIKALKQLNDHVALSSIGHDFDLIEKGTLICKAPRFFQYKDVVPKIEYDVFDGQEFDNKIPNKRIVGIQFKHETIPESTQLSEATRSSQDENITAIPLFYRAESLGHDFIFSFLTKSDPTSPSAALSATDCKLSEINSFHDGMNVLSPDVILEDMSRPQRPGHFVIIEYSTTLSAALDIAQCRFKAKKDKYEAALSRRIKLHKTSEHDNLVSKMIFCIMVATPDGLLTNLPLDDGSLFELQIRFSLYMGIRLRLIAKGWSPEELDRFEQPGFLTKSKALIDMFQSITMKLDKATSFYHPVVNEDFTTQLYGKPDFEYVKSTINKVIERSIKSVSDENHLTGSTVYVRQVVAQSEFLDSKKQLINSINSKGNLMRDHSTKSIIHMPFVVPKWHDTTNQNSDIDKFPMTKASREHSLNDDAHPDLFSNIYHAIQAKDYGFFKENPAKELEIVMSEDYESKEKESKAYRNLYRRVRVQLPHIHELQLAKLGIKGKKYRNHQDVVLDKVEKKSTFTMNAIVSDIDDLLFMSQDFLSRSSATSLDYLYQFKQFHQDSTKMHLGPQFPSEVLDLILSLSGYQWCKMITEIGLELSLSFRQNCKPDDFIVKKLRSCDIYLVIKSLGLRCPLFFSLVIPKTSVYLSDITKLSVFKKLFSTDDYFYTEFSSVNSEKVSNYVKCESTFVTMFAYWAEFYKIPYYDYKGQMNEYLERLKLTDFPKMLILSLMVLLENKSTTEEIITNSRFLLMEGFVSKPILTKPHKIFPKFAKLQIRSRFQVWLLHKMIDLAEYIVQKEGFAINTRPEASGWVDLINPYTKSPLNDAWQVINIMYLGYFKDKNEKPEKNTIGHLYEKILAIEDEFPSNHDHLGIKDPSEPQRHEFSPSFVKFLVQGAKIVLKAERGSDFMNIIEDTIIHNLCFKDLLTTATLKASSNFSDRWYKKINERYTRPRVLEQINMLLKSKADEMEITQVFHILKDCLEFVEKNGAMHICLFKKNQHGGLREIYVLGICERIVQLVLETIARSVCSFFKSETMTNPDSKANIPIQHAIRSRNTFKHGYRTVGCSADAEKWNQGHYVVKFMYLLCGFTPLYMHGFICRALKLFLKKRIMIDYDLIDIIMRNQYIDMGDGITNRIRNAYLGLSKEKWMSQGLCFIETESGMMQGILHYTSSLYHTIYQEWLKRYVPRQISSLLRKTRPGQVVLPKPVVSVLQSSDDSSLLVSFPTTDMQTNIEYLILISVMFRFKALMGRYLGIYDSVKTTAGTLEIMEFNSEFYFSNSQIRPTLRWVSAALTVSEKESLCGRQEEMSNNLSAVISGGGSFSMAALVQYGQLLLNYRLLGLGTNALFNYYYDELREVGDPSLGFFIMDNPMCAGMMGFNYNLYRVVEAVDTFSLQYCFSMSLKSQKDQFLTAFSTGQKVGRVLEMTTSNSLVHTRLLRLGDRLRWRKLVDRLNLPEDWEQYINKNPEVLYREPVNVFELRVRLGAKVFAPGVAESLSQANSVVNTIATCAYAISRHVITDYAIWDLYPDVEKAPKHFKISIIQKLLRSPLGNSSTLLSLGQKSTLFPHLIEYKEYDRVFTEMSEIFLVPYSGHLERRNSEIAVLENLNINLLSPYDLVKHFWFGLGEIVGHPDKIEEHFVTLQEKFTWLSKDPMETLKQSPFSTHVQLQNFFSRMDSKPRHLLISGAPVRVIKGSTNFFTAICRNTFPGYEVTKVKDFERARIKDEMGNLMHHLRLTQIYPFTNPTKRLITEELFRSSTVTALSSIHQSRTDVLSFMSRVAKRKVVEVMYKGSKLRCFPTEDNDWNFLMNFKMGFFGTFDNCLIDTELKLARSEVQRLQIPDILLDQLNVNVVDLMDKDVMLLDQPKEQEIPQQINWAEYEEKYPSFRRLIDLQEEIDIQTSTTDRTLKDDDSGFTLVSYKRGKKKAASEESGPTFSKHVSKQKLKQPLQKPDIAFLDYGEEKKRKEQELLSWLGLDVSTKASVTNAFWRHQRSVNYDRFRTQFSGSRVYKGYFGKEQFIITLVSIRSVAYVTQIEYTNVSDLGIFLQQLKLRANEIGFLNTLSFPNQASLLRSEASKSHHFVGYSKDFNFSSNSGAPIYIKDIDSKTMMANGFLHFDISGSYIKLKLLHDTKLPLYYTKIRKVKEVMGREMVVAKLDKDSTTADVTLFSFQTRDKDILPEIIPLPSNLSQYLKIIHSSWVENRPLDPASLEKFMRTFYYTHDYQFKTIPEIHDRVDLKQLFKMISHRLQMYRRSHLMERVHINLTEVSTLRDDPDSRLEGYDDFIIEIGAMRNITEITKNLNLLEKADENYFANIFNPLALVHEPGMFEAFEEVKDDYTHKWMVPNQWLNKYCHDFFETHRTLINMIENNKPIPKIELNKALWICKMLDKQIDSLPLLEDESDYTVEDLRRMGID